MQGLGTWLSALLSSFKFLSSAGLLPLDFEGRLGVWGCPRNGPDMLMLKVHVLADALSSPPGALVVVWGSFV